VRGFWFELEDVVHVSGEEEEVDDDSETSRGW
jgi:hypothetical protein